MKTVTCKFCQAEFVAITSFTYCSQKCERKHNNLIDKLKAPALIHEDGRVHELMAADTWYDPAQSDQENSIEWLELVRADMVKAGNDVREIDEILEVLEVEPAIGVEMTNQFFKGLVERRLH